MENPRDRLIQKFCRLCLDQSGAKNIFDIKDLARDIYICTGVQVFDTDKLPSKICIKCYERVHMAKELRLLALQCDSHLKFIFGIDIIKSEKKQVNDEESNIVTLRTDLCDSSNELTEEIDLNIVKEEPDPLEYKENSSQDDSDNKLCEDIKKEEQHVKSTPMYKRIVFADDDDDIEIKPCKKVKPEDDVDGFACGECSKMYPTSKKLYLHQRLHNKNLLCPVQSCEKKFASKGDLKKHVRIHTGEKPYECDVCERKFTQRGSLNSHIRIVHEKKKDSSGE